MQVNKIAVIGSGVMGSGIAAQAANGGLEVLLLDIVPDGAEHRNALAAGAIEKQLKTGGFAHPSCAERVTAGNLEDDLKKLKDVDWIIEVVVEKVEIKHKVYQQIDKYRKNGSIISSNTSTIPLAQLMEGMPESFCQDFMISHFFNPPRLMRLIEMVPSPTMDKARYLAACDVVDELFGKAVVHCKDTPGFIANRIGIYWMTYAMNKAFEHNISVEAADQLLGKPIGVPRTAVFGLYDLIGLDLMPLIAEAMKHYVPASEAYHRLNAKPDLMKKMIDDGYTGRKGKGGFFKMEKSESGKKQMFAIDLATGEYHPVQKDVGLASAQSKNIAELLAAKDKGAEYARDVMVTSLHYAASLLGEIADDIDSIDKAMRFGYSWKFGPFELIDQIGTEPFAAYCEALSLDVPAIIQQANGETLYQDNTQLMLSGEFAELPRAKGMLKLGDHGEAVETYEQGKLWQLGDDIYALEITSKMHAIDGAVLDAMEAALTYVEAHGKALVIGSEAPYFSAGANLNYFLDHAKGGALDKVEDLIARGQQMMQSLKYAQVPVVSALTGVALGGGCETLLHSAAVQPHLECHTGLVEVNVGLIPAWGGCKEMLLKRVVNQDSDEEKITALTALFADIVQAKTARSAFEAMDLAVVDADAKITMNVDRLLADAKELAGGLALDKPEHQDVYITLPAGSRAALEAWLTTQEALAPHTKHIATRLIDVLALAENGDVSEQDILDKEREIFIELLATEATQARIEHMLGTGKALGN